MNGITESVLVCNEKLQESGSINWEDIQYLCETIQKTDDSLGESLTRLFTFIKEKHEEELAVAKEIIDAKSEMYDIALAKIQSMEERTTTTRTQMKTKADAMNQHEEEEENMKELEESFLKAISANQIVIEGLSEIDEEEDEMEFAFEHFQSSEDGKEKKKIRFVIQKTQSIHVIKKKQNHKKEDKDEIIKAYKTEIANLREQNNKFLNIGFEWKNKYKAANIKMQEMAEKHMHEMRKLYSVVESLPQN